MREKLRRNGREWQIRIADSIARVVRNLSFRAPASQNLHTERQTVKTSHASWQACFCCSRRWLPIAGLCKSPVFLVYPHLFRMSQTPIRRDLLLREPRSLKIDPQDILILYVASRTYSSFAKLTCFSPEWLARLGLGKAMYVARSSQLFSLLNIQARLKHSQFIKAVTALTGASPTIVVSHELEPSTQTVQIARCTHPDDRGSSPRNVVFVDTPGVYGEGNGWMGVEDKFKKRIDV